MKGVYYRLDKTRFQWHGGYRSERNDRGQHESLHGQTVKGGRISGDHVHFHKDGATVTKGGKKYTIKKSNKS